MTFKYVGAILVIFSCGGVGFSMAAAYHREERLLRQLLEILQFLQCELQYRLTPLPELCRMAGRMGKGSVHAVFTRLSQELDSRHMPEVSDCLSAAMETAGLSPGLRELLEKLGQSLGRFDLNGQLQGLNAVGRLCLERLEALQCNRGDRLRSYQTLGLCTGAALAILFV